MHSVIFCPAERKIWVSTSPWQCGRFVCYDLDEVLASDFSSDIQVASGMIPEDPFVQTSAFRDVLEFKKMLPVIQKAAHSGRMVPDDSLRHFIALDSLYYNAWNAAGDCLRASGRIDDAAACWRKALSLPMKLSERQYIEDKLNNVLRK